jgi:plasmid replication initiation protein
MVQKRGNLKFKTSERFSISELRGILGVPDGKLTTWSNLKNRAIAPSVLEVSELSDYIVEIDPIKTGRSVTHVEMRWWPKDGNAVNQSARELSFSKVGRKERAKERKGAAESFGVPMKPRPAWLERLGKPLRTETYETARMRYAGYDMYHVESEWRSWSEGKGEVNDPDRAFLAFFKTFVERNPL